MPEANQTTATPAPTPGATALGTGQAPAASPVAQATETQPGPIDKQPAPASPETYAFRYPEGWQPDEKLMGEFSPLAQELGLKPEGAQKLVDLFVKAQTTSAQAQLAAREQEQTAWLEAIKGDKDIGGTKLEVTQKSARKAVNYAETKVPGLREWLDSSGMGNAPFLVKAFNLFGQALGEDSIAGTSATAPTQSSEDARLRAMFPTMFFKES